MTHRRRGQVAWLSLAAALSLATFAFGQTKGALRHPDVIRMTVSGTSFYWTFTANQNGVMTRCSVTPPRTTPRSQPAP